MRYCSAALSQSRSFGDRPNVIELSARKRSCNWISRRCGVGLLNFMLVSAAMGQVINAPTPVPSTTGNYGSSSGANSAVGPQTQGAFSGSVPEGKATSEVLPLSFRDAL